jgi:hypothetical protein
MPAVPPPAHLPEVPILQVLRQDTVIQAQLRRQGRGRTRQGVFGSRLDRGAAKRAACAMRARERHAELGCHDRSAGP